MEGYTFWDYVWNGPFIIVMWATFKHPILFGIFLGCILGKRRKSEREQLVKELGKELKSKN